MMRFALGTVQFGQQYGIANMSGQVNVETAAAILTRARSSGVDTLDTAIAYGESEACLGEAGVSSWFVVTKLPPLPPTVTRISEWIHAQVHGSLGRLRIARLEGLLLHRPSDILGPAGADVIRVLEELKTEGLIGVAGISISNISQLDAICRFWKPDVVQAPCNVFNRQLIRSGWLERLREKGVRVYIRSLFLQGLLLMPPARRPGWFSRWDHLLSRWTNWCDENRTTPLQATLAFAQTLPGIERFVVGVDSVKQWEEIRAAAFTAGPLPPEDLFSDDPDLIEPSRWKLT